MDSRGKIWVALDTDWEKALEIAHKLSGHPAVGGFKINRLIDQALLRTDGYDLLEELADIGPLWADLKLMDIPETVGGRMQAYADSDLLVSFVTVMAKGGINMMKRAVEVGERRTLVIAVTELTSLTEEEVHLLSGQPAKTSVVNLARLAVLAGVKYLVCSGREVATIKAHPELSGLQLFVPGITPAWSQVDASDQKRTMTPVDVFKAGGEQVEALVIGRAIVKADDPRAAIDKTVEEIEAV